MTLIRFELSDELRARLAGSTLVAVSGVPARVIDGRFVEVDLPDDVIQGAICKSLQSDVAFGSHDDPVNTPPKGKPVMAIDPAADRGDLEPDTEMDAEAQERAADEGMLSPEEDAETWGELESEKLDDADDDPTERER